MYKIELNQTLCRIVEIFYYMGIWDKDNKPTFPKFLKNFFQALIIALFAIFLATNALLCDDKNESIFVGQVVVLTTVILVKCLYLILKKQDILAFLYDPIMSHSTEDRKQHNQSHQKIDKFMKFTHFYLFMLIVPLILTIGIKLPIISSDKGLPMFISFSWNNSEIIYWLAFVFVSLSMVLCVTINLLSILIWYIMLNYSIEYEHLGSKIRNLGWEIKVDIKKKVNKKKAWSIESKLAPKNSFVDNLIILVKAQQNLKELKKSNYK